METPSVERISPELAVGGKIVRRDTCHPLRRAGFLVDLEEFRIPPNVGTISSDEYRDITDDFDLVGLG